MSSRSVNNLDWLLRLREQTLLLFSEDHLDHGFTIPTFRVEFVQNGKRRYHTVAVQENESQFQNTWNFGYAINTKNLTQVNPSQAPEVG